MEKSGTADKTLIIGGGIAGLACGCYLQMNGYQTEILEANDAPGGLCVAWERGSYLFDGCLRWLLGTRPSSSFYKIWQELGAIEGRKIIERDELLRFESADGRALSLPTDLGGLINVLKAAAPEDAARLDQLAAAARRCRGIEPPEKALELMGGPEKMRLLMQYLPMLFTIGKWKGRRLADYLATYRSQLLREVLLSLAGDERMSGLVLVMVLAWRSENYTAYVAGGSRAFSQAVARRYQQLGGTFRFQTRVESVLVENGRATGVRCADGTLLPAATVISCADGYTTLFKMLAGRFVTRLIRKAYTTCDVFPGLLQVSLGINREYPAEAETISLPLSPPLKVDDCTEHTRLELALCGPDTGLCPAGHSVMLARMASRYEYWANLSLNQPGEYRKAKAALLEQVVAILDRRFPGLSAHLEESDLATPATFARYTGNWQASFQGWLPTPRILGRRLPRTLPGLTQFYMAGHWIEPGGGLPSVALSARFIAQMICARDGKTFHTSLSTEPAALASRSGS